MDCEKAAYLILMAVKSAAFASVISTVKDIILGVAAIVGVVVAVKGLNIWRRQLKGTNEYQIALKVLKGIFSLRDAISGARERLILSVETGDRPRSERENQDETQVMNVAHAYHKRLQFVRSAYSELLLAELEALALWGQAVGKTLEPVYNAVNHLFATYSTYFEADLLRARSGDRPDETLREMHKTLFRVPDNDRFGKTIEDAVKAGEEHFRQYLK